MRATFSRFGPCFNIFCLYNCIHIATNCVPLSEVARVLFRKWPAGVKLNHFGSGDAQVKAVRWEVLDKKQVGGGVYKSIIQFNLRWECEWTVRPLTSARDTSGIFLDNGKDRDQSCFNSNAKTNAYTKKTTTRMWTHMRSVAERERICFLRQCGWMRSTVTESVYDLMGEWTTIDLDWRSDRHFCAASGSCLPRLIDLSVVLGKCCEFGLELPNFLWDTLTHDIYAVQFRLMNTILWSRFIKDYIFT